MSLPNSVGEGVSRSETDGVWSDARPLGDLHVGRRQVDDNIAALSIPHPAFGHLPRWRGEGVPLQLWWPPVKGTKGMMAPL